MNRTGLLFAVFAICGATVFAQSDELRKAQLQDFDVIQANIEKYHPSHWEQFELVKLQTLRTDALILEADRTPIDVILRRTQALLNHLNASSLQKDLDNLKKKNIPDLSEPKQHALFIELSNLRRKVAFSNPLLDFKSLVFLKHHPKARGDNHMVDQYLGVNQAAGGGVFRLDAPFTEVPKVASLLKDDQLNQKTGSFISLDLDYDGKQMLFAYTDLDWNGKVHANIIVPGAKHIYWINKLDAGYRVSTGYGKSIVDITTEGNVVRTLGGTDDYFFFSRPFELTNGNIVACNWTGHKPTDSEKAPQLVEFDAEGNVVWKWHDPKRAGTIHGVIILD